MSWLLNLLQGLPPELITVVVAAAPISELRGAIPLAVGVFGFTIWKAFGLALIGNIVPVFFVYFFLEGVSRLLSKIKFFQKFFEWWFERSRRKFNDHYLKYGKLALVIFVAIPLPMTGAWTGTVAAWLLGIKPKQGIPLILIGVVIAGIIISALTLGVGRFF